MRLDVDGSEWLETRKGCRLRTGKLRDGNMKVVVFVLQHIEHLDYILDEELKIWDGADCVWWEAIVKLKMG